MAQPLRWAISLLLLAASVASLVSFGLLGVGREGGRSMFSFDYQVMYLGGLAWLKHRNPYNQDLLDQTFHEYYSSHPGELPPEKYFDAPFSYPPHSAAYFVPLAFLSLPAAKHAWWCVNLLVLAGVVAMTLHSLRKAPGGLSDPLSWAIPVAFIVGNPLTTNCFWQGQTSLVAFAASMGGWFFSRQGRWVLAGLCLGIGSTKPQLCLFIMFWLLLERNWKPIAMAVLTAAVLSIYPMTVHGPIGMATDWLERLRTHQGEFEANKPGFEHVVGVQSLLAAAGLPEPAVKLAGTAAVVAGLAAVVGLYAARRRFTWDDLLGLMMGLTVSLIFVHDVEYVALIPLFTALWLHFWEQPRFGPGVLFLAAVLLFYFPRRIIRDRLAEPYDLPVLSHWRTVVVLALVLTLLVVGLRQSARRSLQPAPA
jgi:hypothetical protein